MSSREVLKNWRKLTSPLLFIFSSPELPHHQIIHGQKDRHGSAQFCSSATRSPGSSHPLDPVGTSSLGQQPVWPQQGRGQRSSGATHAQSPAPLPRRPGAPPLGFSHPCGFLQKHSTSQEGLPPTHSQQGQKVKGSKLGSQQDLKTGGQEAEFSHFPEKSKKSRAHAKSEPRHASLL